MRPATRGSTNERLKRSLTQMASRLRPTPEFGTVAATQMPASSIGPSWAARGSREARLAFRQAQRRGDREGAMRIAMSADKAGLASQASIGSAEQRLAGEYQGRGADTAVTAEIETALTPPGLSRDMIDTPAGPRNAPRAGVQEQTAQKYSTPPAATQPAATQPAATQPAATQPAATQPAATQPAATQPAATQPATPEQPPAPGASQPPENPVSGSSTPVTGDPESRLGKRWTPALQGVAGRRALSENLRKSIAAGGGDLSGDRLKRAKAEADRLGIAPEQFLGELQDLGASVPGEDMKTLMPQDNRSLDRKLRDYQDKYLGGGPSSELTSRLRTDSAANRSAAESMRLAREQDRAKQAAASLNRGPSLSVDPTLARSFKTPAPAPASTPPAAPANTPAADRFNLPLYRTSMGTREARVQQVRQQEVAARDAAIAAQRQRIEAQLPEWQRGTILGQMNVGLRRFLTRQPSRPR